MNPDVIWLCATRREWIELKKKIHFTPNHTLHNFNFYSGWYNRMRVELGQMGVGMERARIKAYALFNSLPRMPRHVIHFGFSGGLIENLVSGRVVIPTEIKNGEGEVVAPSSDLIQKATSLCQKLDMNPLSGSLFSSEKILVTPTEKKEAGIKTNCQIIDQETFPFAKICAQKGIPFLSVRAVWDPLEWDVSLLHSTEPVDQDGETKIARIMKGAIQHPKLLMSLPRYQSAASQGNKALARIVLTALDEWN